jgi:SAM-dependent methyltransferase
METQARPKGVLDETYVHDRATKPEFQFRLATRARAFAQVARSHLPDHSRFSILDMGCAEGRTMREMNRLLPRSTITGVEYADYLVESAGELPNGLRIMQGDITALPNCIAPESYDMVSALAVLEHLTDPLAAIRGVRKVLRPGGIFVATCPSPVWDHLAVRFGLLKGEFHVTEMDKRALVEVVKAAGLELVEYRRFMWVAVAFLPYLRVPVPSLLALRVDRVVESVRFLDWMFVNQLVTARKPA